LANGKPPEPTGSKFCADRLWLNTLGVARFCSQEKYEQFDHKSNPNMGVLSRTGKRVFMILRTHEKGTWSFTVITSPFSYEKLAKYFNPTV